MSNIPSILSSAQSVLQTGFTRQNKAAAEVATAAADDQDTDSLVTGVVDLTEAKAEVRSGVGLMHAYEQTTADLLDMTDTRPYRRRLDVYA